MAQRYVSEEGRALYKLRCQSVEPVFGQIKDARQCRRFQRRGREAVESEWNLICATHNLFKLFRHARQSAQGMALTVPAAQGA